VYAAALCDLLTLEKSDMKKTLVAVAALAASAAFAQSSVLCTALLMLTSALRKTLLALPNPLLTLTV